MENRGENPVVAGIDVFVALFIIIVGFLVILYGNDWLNYVSMISEVPYTTISYNPFVMFYKIPWIILFSGLAIMTYGIKRFADNISKIAIKK
jgi:hypothetical protein